MRKLLRIRFVVLQRFLSKFPGFSNPEKYSLAFLNSAQFLGALNDNIYKLVLIFYLIQLEGAVHANAILSAAGAIFVIPFLLFSSAAGILADRFSKNRLIILIKSTEIAIMVFAILAFAFKFSWSSYCLLFLLSTQSAMFGPSKYGIIPELVSKNNVSKANGLITSFTYLAIIFGTFLASFLTEITNRNYVVTGTFCLFVAIIGFLSSFGIKFTPPRGTKKKINPFFIREIYQILVQSKQQTHLLVAISCSAYFLFIGAFTQLNIIPYAMESLNLSEIAGGYLFLTSAIGIAAGALVAGRASKTHIELGLSCFGGFFISLFFVLLFVFTKIPFVVITILLLGFFGGIFTVPVDSFIQLKSPEKNRGHVIAAANFLSFVGVLIASFALFFLNQVLKFSAAQSFLVMGVLTFLFTFFIILRLSDFFLSYTAKKILIPLVPIETRNIDLLANSQNPLLMLEEGSFLKAWLLCGVLHKLNLLFPQYKKYKFPWFRNLFFSLHRIESPDKFEEIINKSQQFQKRDTIPCIYLIKKKPIPEKQSFHLPIQFFQKNFEVISVSIKKLPSEKKRIILFSK